MRKSMAWNLYGVLSQFGNPLSESLSEHPKSGAESVQIKAPKPNEAIFGRASTS